MDSKEFSNEVRFKIIKEVAINTQNQDKSGKIIKFTPTLFATYGIILIGKETSNG